jgi:REP element-mobilizing transposase RayT
MLVDEVVAGALADEWRNADQRHGWLVGRYVIMPDHVHFFCTADSAAKSLSEFVRLWKQWTTKRIVPAVDSRSLSGVPPQGPPRLASAATTRIWQREFFDHVLRTNESYAQKWEYVRANPVRHGLVKRPEEWPFQGEIHPLEFCSRAC